MSGNNTILIVDDNTENLRILKTYLNDAGYKVSIASNGVSSVERAERIKPKLILLDVKMPGMNGFEVCAKLKMNSALNHIPVIFVTAASDDESIAKGFEVGGTDYITKPLKKQELLARVKNHIKTVNATYYLEQLIKDRTQELQESEKRYRIAIEGTQDGLWDWNLQTNEAFMSNRFETMLGYSPGELPRTGEAWLSLLHPDDKMEAMESLQQYLNKEVGKYESTFRMRTKKGIYIWISGRGKAEFDEKGNPVRVVGFNTDITPKKESEIKLREKNKELQESIERIKEMNTQLEEAKLRSEESDRLKTTFLANLSHEIRTPMNGILGFAELLEEGNIPEDKQKLYIQTIHKSGIRMLNLINDLIDISKIEANQVAFTPSQTKLNKIIDEIFVFFKPETEHKNLDFTAKKSLPEEEANILADKRKIEQALTNLIKNAIKFTQKGKIEFGYEKMEDNLIFWVKDTGPGIPPGKKETIFERFRQVEDTPFRAEEGIGLGLSISKAFVEIMNGKIWLDSELNKGSTFYFSIPFVPLESKIMTQKQRDVYRPYSRSTVLVAEDDEISFLFIKEILLKYSINVLRASNGKEALEAVLNKNNIDLILMDIKMPLMNGLDATRAIINTNKGIPIVAQTAYASDPDKKKVAEAGCTDYITKPIDKIELKKVLDKYLKEHIVSSI